MNPFIEILQQSFVVLLKGVVGFAPTLIIAFILIAFGFIIGAMLERVIVQFIRILKVDELLDGAGVRNFLARGGVRLDAGQFGGGLIKWFTVLAFFMVGLQVLGLSQVNAFLTTIIFNYIPQVIIAALMLLVAAVGARAVKTIIVSSLKAFRVSAAHFLGAIASAAIWIGTIIFIFSQLGIAPEFMKILFIGIVGACSLAFGLAFGLGGKEEAALLLAKMRKDAINHF